METNKKSERDLCIERFKSLVADLRGRIRQYDRWTLEEISILLQTGANLLEIENNASSNVQQWFHIIRRLLAGYENQDVVYIADIIQYEMEFC